MEGGSEDDINEEEDEEEDTMELAEAPDMYGEEGMFVDEEEGEEMELGMEGEEEDEENLMGEDEDPARRRMRLQHNLMHRVDRMLDERGLREMYGFNSSSGAGSRRRLGGAGGSGAPSFRSIGDAVNAARISMNGEGNMRIRLSDSSTGGLMDFLGQLPAALSMNGVNAAVSILNPDGTINTTGSSGGNGPRGDRSRTRMQQFMSAISSGGGGHSHINRVDFFPTPSIVHPLLTLGSEHNFSRGRLRSGSNPIQARRQNIYSSGDSLQNIDREAFLGDAPRSRPSGGQRRSSLGPLLSDRRWGTDIGTEADLGESRMPLLTSAVEEALGISVATSGSGSLEKRPKDTAAYQKLTRILNAMSSGEGDLGMLHEIIEDDGESKEEGELQEYKEGEDELEYMVAEGTRDGLPLGSAQQEFDATNAAVDNTPVVERETERTGLVSEENGVDAEEAEMTDHLEVEEAETEQAVPMEVVETAVVECPEGYDPEVWASLPPELQLEVLASSVNEGDLSAGMDSDVLAQLPEDLRSQFIPEERGSASIPLNSRPEQDENLTFLSSLSSDLRREVLLTAEDAFLSSLPPSVQLEAQRLRRGMGVALQHHQLNAEDRLASITGEQPSTSLGIQQQQLMFGEDDLYWNPMQGSAREMLQGLRSRASRSFPSAVAASAPQLISTTLTTADDRLLIPLPFDQALVWRLLHHLVVSKKARCPRPLLRLLACLCRYKYSRKYILVAIAALLRRDSDRVRASMTCIEPTGRGSTETVLAITAFCEKSFPTADMVSLRRILSALSYLSRKVTRLVWLDIMQRDKGGTNYWIFGNLMELLGQLARSPGQENAVDLVLHVIDEACEPLSKLTPGQVKELIAAEASGYDVIPDAPSNQEVSVSLPFPVLFPAQLDCMADVIRVAAPRQSSNKMLTRILKTLSLSDSNWNRVLLQLQLVARDLARECEAAIDEVCVQLREVVERQGGTAQVMGLPLFSRPSFYSEHYLFQVLQHMKGCRAPEISSASGDLEEESVLIGALMRDIDFGAMWVRLSESLDLVRRIEGLNDQHVGRELGEKDSASIVPVHASGRPEARKKMAASLSSSTSSLIMRFMPLIQSFLTVCDCTVLHKPTDQSSYQQQQGNSPMIDAYPKDAMQLRRKRSHDYASSTTSNVFDSALAMLVKPGEKFRRHADYFKMQMELQEGEELSDQLIHFVEQNALLINMFLNQNISLLDSSFRPLICVPRLRHQLHFDLKREYFRVKLKKMRNSAGRMHGPLRLNVRRDHVFEDSLDFFEKLRTGDEVRRKLAITFSGEEVSIPLFYLPRSVLELLYSFTITSLHFTSLCSCDENTFLEIYYWLNSSWLGHGCRWTHPGVVHCACKGDVQSKLCALHRDGGWSYLPAQHQ